MTKVEFIGHSKHLNGIRKASDGSLELVPLKLVDTIRELVRLKGFGGLLATIAGRDEVVDLRPVVERNLIRRRIRFGWFYSNPLVAAMYRAMVLPRARIPAALLKLRFDEHPEARALVFNGFLMPDALTLEVSKALGRERLVMELGFFPKMLQYDRKGINYDSTLPRDPAFYRMVEDRIGKDMPADLVRRQSKQKGSKTVSLPPSYVFVPFQVPSDMQVLAHSPWIRDMVHFYEVIARLADRQPDVHFVIKEHPSFPLSIRGHVKPHARIHFANHNETRGLIEGADAVIVMNSTVGLESVFLGKKVITIGNAPYNVDGLVLHAGDDGELASAFERLKDWRPDANLRTTVIRYIYNVFLLRGDRNNADAAMMEALRQRAEGSDQHSLFLREFAERPGHEDRAERKPVREGPY